MSVPFPEPASPCTDTKTRFLDYLDFYRSVVIAKVDGLPEDELHRSRVPSGWTPIQLVKHLLFMERRWLQWGFAAAHVSRPWGDHVDDDPEQGWYVEADETLAELVAALQHTGRRTREIVEAADSDQRAGVGGRFASQDTAPRLEWILFHVLQEYARHAGHLDIARELADGSVGE